MLASGSKARRNLLQKVGISHHLMVSDINEESFDQVDGPELVKALAFAKAEAVLSKIISGSFHRSSRVNFTNISNI